MENSFVFVVSMTLTLAVTTQGCIRCGTSGACCTADETCETTVDDGTCYKTKDKITCNSNYHCYSPTICCGYSFIGKTICCPQESKCCKWIVPFCCPLNSRCGRLSECYSNNGSSSSSGSSDSRGSIGSSSSSPNSSGTTSAPPLAMTTQWCIRCGTSEACCTAGETCERTVDDGTCYKTKDRNVCSNTYTHCYKPRICCGYSFIGTTVCCPGNSRCCRSTTPFCCPLNSRCGSLSKCYSDSDSTGSRGYHISSDTSGSNGSSSSSFNSSIKTFRWYYIVAAVSVVSACVAVGVRVWLRNKGTAQAQPYTNRRVVYSPCTTSLPSTAATVSNITYGVNPQPPVFNPPTQDVNIPGTTGYDCVVAQTGKTMPPPPTYSEIFGQVASTEAGVITAASPPQGIEHV